MCVCLADSGGGLEIKTLCRTRLMIGLELKQKAEEHTEKLERGEEKENGESSRRRRNVLSERGRSERLPPQQSYSLCLDCFIIRMSGGPFPLAHFCQESA